jgi:phosphohistidine phosphatase
MTGETPVRKAARKPATQRAAAVRQRGPGGRFAPAAKTAIAAADAPAAKQAAARETTSKKVLATKVSATKAPAAQSAPRAAAVAPAAPALEAAVAGGLVLYLLRHADAGDPATWPGDDGVRPLSKKGRKQARRLGRHLDSIGVDLAALVTSPKVRAADTARLVGKALGVKPADDARLGGGFDPGGLQSLLGGLTASTASVMLVGHDPDFSSLASWLTDAPIELRKGALVRIDLPNRQAGAGSGALRWLLPPDAVPG